jgi:hypothetical protein
VFIGKVTTAWNNLKTPERRNAYDEQQRSLQGGRKSVSKSSRSRSGRYAAQKPFTNGGPRGTRFGGPRARLRGAAKIGLLRWAIAVLFQRPFNRMH